MQIRDFDILITVIHRNVKYNDFFSVVYLPQFFMQFLVFVDLLFQPHIFRQYLIISKSVKYVALLHIIVTYMKDNTVTKLPKLYSPPRKSPALLLKKTLCTGDLSPACKIFIERPGSDSPARRQDRISSCQSKII